MDQNITAVVLCDESIDYAETRVLKKLGIRESFEIPSRFLIEAMIILVGFLEVGKTAWDRRSPNYNELFSGMIIEQLRRPDVHGGGLIGHHWDELLLGPMHEVFRISVTKALVCVPTGGPDYMESAIVSAGQARISQQFAGSDVGFQQRTRHICPVIPVKTVEETEAVFAVATKGREQISGILGWVFSGPTVYREKELNNEDRWPEGAA